MLRLSTLKPTGAIRTVQGVNDAGWGFVHQFGAISHLAQDGA